MGLANAAPVPAEAAAPVSKKILRKRNIDSLSYRDAEPWLRKINKPLSNTLAKRRRALWDYFDDKPDNYELTL